MATSPAAAFEALVDGVTSWNVPRGPIPRELLLTGEASFPVMVNDKGQVLIAASLYGRGRLVVVSHEAYLVDASLAPFLLSALHWLCPLPGVPVGVHSSLASLLNILQGSGVEAQTQPELGDSLGVYCISAYNDTLTAELTQFVKRGGALLIGGQAWYWASRHGCDKVLSNFPGNQVTSVAGAHFTNTYGDRGPFKVSKKVPMIPLLVRCGQDRGQDQQQLLEGISELDITTGGAPWQLVHGALAFPLGLDASYGCFLAAACYGRGWVVLAAHESMLCAPKMRPFLLNAVHWLARGQTGKVGVNTSLKNLCGLLSEHGLECSLGPCLTGDLRVYCCVAYSDKEAKQLQEFVAEGGGLLIGGLAWWWASQNPGRSTLAGFPGNVILNCFGLSFLASALDPGCFPVPTPEMRSYHFRKALSEFQAVLNHRDKNLEKSWLAKLGVDGAAFLQIPAEGVPAYLSLHQLLRKMLDRSGVPAVSWEKPVARDSCEAAALCLATELARSGTDCSQLTQGLVTGTCNSSLNPSEQPITVEISGSHAGNGDSWVSTGLYLLSGRTAEVSLSEAAVSAGLKVQIGCHTDDLTKASKLSRAPVVTHQYLMDRTKRSVSCLWGGLLYVIVPKGRKLGPVSVTIKRAVPAPYFRLGWMHAGYPIMCHLQSVQELINETGIRSRGLWGPVHELGHNQQQHGWEFPPHTTEATCNLWSVYVHETVLDIPRAQAHPALSCAEREKRIKMHLGKGAPLRDWNVWTALETYLQLQEAFGWEPFTQLFAEYQTLSGVPSDNAGKMNLWVKKFSEKVQKNLVPFFEAWGRPVKKEVADSLACLPPWQENPMQLYMQTKV
ncbi:hypothetical protein MC885_014531 [Smutsia gigantea]|nr:hypothetical protein MC885_014531 [Smutsia gigantea]